MNGNLLERKNLFVKNRKTGNIYLAGAGKFFREQSLRYPDLAELYRHQLKVVLAEASEEIKTWFPVEDVPGKFAGATVRMTSVRATVRRNSPVKEVGVRKRSKRVYARKGKSGESGSDSGKE